ncbi:unnamed protein product [Cochlearia groenlandica]
MSREPEPDAREKPEPEHRAKPEPEHRAKPEPDARSPSNGKIEGGIITRSRAKELAKDAHTMMLKEEPRREATESFYNIHHHVYVRRPSYES